ncbi:MAG: hypothetical protein ABIL58_20945 [Pseudomonadota bacterium]
MDLKPSQHLNFVFVCPECNRVFETAAFSIVDNRGVVTDADGNKALDATVALNDPCPYCGQRHVYPASELLCPFRGAQ